MNSRQPAGSTLVSPLVRASNVRGLLIGIYNRTNNNDNNNNRNKGIYRYHYNSIIQYIALYIANVRGAFGIVV